MARVVEEPNVAPAPMPVEELRALLGPDAQGLSETQLRQLTTLVSQRQQQYSGVPAILAVMAEIDAEHGSGLLDHYMATVKSDQDHTRAMDREERGFISKAVMWGLVLTGVIVISGILAAALVPEAAAPIMTGVGVVAALLAGPKLIDSLKGSGSAATDTAAKDESTRQR